MSNTLEYAIKILDQYGEPLKRFEEGIKSSTKKVNGLDDALSRVQRKKSPYDTHNRSLADLRQNLERYKRAAENSFRADHMRRYNVLIDETKKKIKQLEDSTKTCGEKTKTFFGNLKENFGIGKGFIAGAVIAKIGQLAYQEAQQSIKSASEVEKYQVTLKTMLGTADAARSRMQEYFNIAKKTPFDLPQVVEAGNKLQALGRYSRDNVVMLGDLAAASGKPMEQAMSAFAKLASGQKGIAIDMFRDLMITTKDWTAATGKGVSKSGELLATTEELIAALPKIMKSKGFFGMMANQAETTEGKVANLGDAVFQLRAALGEHLQPAYNKVVSTATQVIEKYTTMIEIPIEQKIAREKVELNSLVGALMDANTKGDQRNSIIDKLQQKYPDFLKNIDLEKASTAELRAELEKTNAEYDKKIRLSSYKRRIEQLEDDMEKSGVKILDYEMAIQAEEKQKEAGRKLDSFLRERGFASDKSIGYKIDKDGNVLFRSQGSPFDLKASKQLSEADKTTAIKLRAEYESAFGFVKANPIKGLESEKQQYEEYKYQRQLIENIYNNEQQEGFKELLEKAKKIDVKDKSTYEKLFGNGKNAGTLAKEFESLRNTTFDKLDDAKALRIQQFIDGTAPTTPTTPATPAGVPTTPTNDIGGKSTSIASGGTRNTEVNITLGSMVENMNFNGNLTENKQDIENQLMQILSRVLGMAAVS